MAKPRVHGALTLSPDSPGSRTGDPGIDTSVRRIDGRWSRPGRRARRGRASSRDSRLFGRLELPQVLPQGRARVLGTHRAPLLEQRDDLVHEGLDVARPDALADGEAVAPHRVDGPRQLV